MKIQVMNTGQNGNPLLHNAFEIETLFPSSWLGTFNEQGSAMNIIEDSNCYCIDVYAPGFEKRNFKVAIENNIITITAKKEISENKLLLNSIFGFDEYNHDSFSRSFKLPGNTLHTQVTAIYKNDILQLIIPKNNPLLKKEVLVQ